MSEFQIRKDDFTKYRVVDAASSETLRELPDGGVRAKIERFAFTANNVTYAVTGERLGYWQFFPPGGDDTDGWGMMPVWGFATVVESKASDVPVGDRLFGYFPPAKYLDMTPTRVTDERIIDGATHRAKLPPAYNSYSRVNAEPGYDRALDDLRMLLWPLHITSFCLWDALRNKDWYGAKQVVIVSASSKTSIGLAYALADDAAAPVAIAITSERNFDFVKRLKLYEQSVTYQTLSEIDAAIPTVIVDMSGNREVLGRLHAHLGDNMKRCINVGLTHWDDKNAGDGLIAERSEIFFAPSHIQQRVKDWGPDGFAKKTASFMHQTAAKSQSWLKLRKIDGLAGLADVYGDVCAGRIPADQGLIIEL